MSPFLRLFVLFITLILKFVSLICFYFLFILLYFITNRKRYPRKIKNTRNQITGSGSILKSEYMIRPPKVTQKHGLESFIICQNPL